MTSHTSCATSNGVPYPIRHPATPGMNPTSEMTCDLRAQSSWLAVAHVLAVVFMAAVVIREKVLQRRSCRNLEHVEGLDMLKVGDAEVSSNENPTIRPGLIATSRSQPVRGGCAVKLAIKSPDHLIIILIDLFGTRSRDQRAHDASVLPMWQWHALQIGFKGRPTLSDVESRLKPPSLKQVGPNPRE